MSVTIAGITLALADGDEGEPIMIGEAQDSFTGVERVASRGQKRQWTFVTAPTTVATFDSLRAAVDEKVAVTCSGLLLSGDTITASVVVRGKLETGTTSPRYIISGSIREKSPS